MFRIVKTHVTIDYFMWKLYSNLSEKNIDKTNKIIFQAMCNFHKYTH